MAPGQASLLPSRLIGCTSCGSIAEPRIYLRLDPSDPPRAELELLWELALFDQIVERRIRETGPSTDLVTSQSDKRCYGHERHSMIECRSNYRMAQILCPPKN